MTTSQTNTHVNLPKAIGRGYGAFWRSKHRYRVIKGSRASKKSKTIALWYMVHLMKYPLANLLVVRKSGRSLPDSCFSELKWAANRLKIDHLWKFTINPLKATNLKTGQCIYFRGLDDPLKITSITVETGVLNFLWIEEAYEIMSESNFDTLDESIRGEMPPGYFKQTTLSFNPWNDRHWLKKRFFDVESPDIFATTTNYLCNEFLDEADRRMFEDMKKRNPRRYQVAGLGNWGIVDGLVYENWKEEAFTLTDLPQDAELCPGLDYGFTNDPTAIVHQYYSRSQRRIYIYDEAYEKGLSNRKIAEKIKHMGLDKSTIVGDSAEQKSNAELRSYGLNVKGSIKGPGSLNAGIQWIQDQEIIIHPRCNNFITEISNYGFAKDKLGNLTNNPMDDFNHLQDAMRYGLEKYIRANKKPDTATMIKNLKRMGL